MSAKKGHRGTNGRFQKGCQPGPGRPKGHATKFHRGELIQIAQPIEPKDLFLFAAKMDGMEEVVAMICRDNKHSPATKKAVQLEIDNRNLASMLINKMLLAELDR